MSDNNALLRRLEREIRARKKAEEISENKMTELYNLNLQLDHLLSEQKKINKQLHQSTLNFEMQRAKVQEERYGKSILKNILESSMDYSIISLNLQGLILVWNEGARRTYGYAADEVVNKKNIRMTYTPEDVNAGRVDQLFNTAFQEGKAEGVFERIRKDGSRFMTSVNVSLRRYEENVPIGYVTISKDITKENLLKEKLIKSNRDLEQFAYIVSHDLKAPLRAIERLSSWIAEDCKDKLDETSKKNLTLMRQRTIRMANLIDGILRYSRAGRDMDISEIDIKTLLEEVIDTLDPSKNFTIKYGENLPKFKTAKTSLSQVFSNLISNGIKHHHRKKGVITIGAKDLGNFYEFYVQDDGPGIDQRYFKKIFQIFQTLHYTDEMDTTGIGLSIVKKIIEYQGGTINLESTVGKGSTFRFTWPKIIKDS